MLDLGVGFGFGFGFGCVVYHATLQSDTARRSSADSELSSAFVFVSANGHVRLVPTQQKAQAHC